VTFEDVPSVSTADVPDSRDTASLVSSASPGQQGVGRSPEQSSRHLRWSLRQQQSTVPEGEASSTEVASSTPHKRKSLSSVKRVSTSPSAKQVYSDSDIGEEWSQGPRRGVVTQDKTRTTTTTTTGAQATVKVAEHASQTDLHCAPSDCLLVLQGGSILRIGSD